MRRLFTLLAFLWAAPLSAQSIFVGQLPNNCTADQIAVSIGNNSWICGAGGDVTAPGSNTEVVFNDSGAFGADAGLTYVKASDALTVVGWIDLLSTGVRASAADGVLTLLGLGNGNDENLTIDLDNAAANTIALASGTGAKSLTWAGDQRNTATYTTIDTGHSGLESDVTVTMAATEGGQQINGLFADMRATGTFGLSPNGSFNGLISFVAWGGGTVTNVTGSYAYAYAEGASGTITNLASYWGFSTQVYTSGIQVTNGYGFYLDPVFIESGANVDFNYGIWLGSQRSTGIDAGTSYAFWYDGGGGSCDTGAVTRINDLGIFAYYNPCFTAYTPAAANFERLILRFGDTGVYGTDNIAYMGMEVGGTGTNRVLNVLGASVGVMSVPGTYATLTSSAYITSGTSPAVANIGANSCGTSAASIAGTDNAWSLTVGATSGTACRVTFDTTAPNAWECAVNNQTTFTLDATPHQTASTTTTVDISATGFVAGDVIHGVCVAR